MTPPPAYCIDLVSPVLLMSYFGQYSKWYFLGNPSLLKFSVISHHPTSEEPASSQYTMHNSTNVSNKYVFLPDTLVFTCRFNSGVLFIFPMVSKSAYTLYVGCFSEEQ